MVCSVKELISELEVSTAVSAMGSYFYFTAGQSVPVLISKQQNKDEKLEQRKERRKSKDPERIRGFRGNLLEGGVFGSARVESFVVVFG